jgi:hypothetical protein
MPTARSSHRRPVGLLGYPTIPLFYHSTITNPGAGWYEATGPWGKCAKRTQFFDCGLRILDCGFRKACGPPPGLAGLAVQTNPIGRSRSCKTKPISSTLTPTRGRNWAKQSQTWAGWDIWRTARQGGRFCETKPIPRRTGGRPIPQNEPNFCRSLTCQANRDAKCGRRLK